LSRAERAEKGPSVRRQNPSAIAGCGETPGIP
jgi:hypothetical protein